MSFWKLLGLSSRKKQPLLPLSLRTDPTRQARKDIAAPNFELMEVTQTAKRPAPADGFDPYNTGSFDRRKTWETANRR